MYVQPLKRAWWKLHEWVSVQRDHQHRAGRRDKVGRFLFRTLGWAINRPGSMFVLNYRPDFDYDFGRFPDYARFQRYWVKGNVENSGDLTRLYLLYLNARRVVQEDIAGDFVELGVYKGNSAKLLCEIARPAERRLFLFDTFLGFDSADLASERDRVHEKFVDTSLEGVRRFVGEDLVTYVPGRFPESLGEGSLPPRIALAHIDCDLYEPMKAGLQVFYERMSPGGLFVLHDYSSGWWRGATQAVDEFLADKPERLTLMPDACGTAVFRKH